MSTVYGSDGFAYDFEAALDVAKVAELPLPEQPTRRPLPESVVQLERTVDGLRPITKVGLERHRKAHMPTSVPRDGSHTVFAVRKMHNDAVDEVAMAYGLGVEGKGTNGKAARARELYAAGWPVPKVAAEVKLSRGAVQKYVEEVSTP